jgi:hypothetical protein
VREGDTLYVCLQIQDLDWAAAQGEQTNEEQGVVMTMISMWSPYVALGVDYGPEPPVVSTDRTGADYGEGDRDYYFAPPPAQGNTVAVELEWLVPQFNGPNQARLRGLIDYDVKWLVTITVRNGSANSPPQEGTLVDAVSFWVCALENPNLVPGNPPPFADAGGEQTVTVGDTVRLDGSRSYDGSNVGFDPFDPEVYDKDMLQYNWEWVSGPERVDPQPDPDAPPTVVAGRWPVAVVTLDVAGTYAYRLLVDDGVNSPPSTDEVTIRVLPFIAENRKPRAVITGPTRPVAVGGKIVLSATDSSDPDGDALSYRWRQTNEVGGALMPDEVLAGFQPLDGVTSETASWIAIEPGTYYFQLLVTDPAGLSDTALTSVEVVEVATTGNTASRASDGSESNLPADKSAGSAGNDSPAAPAACGGGALLPLAVLPGLLGLMRGRRR